MTAKNNNSETDLILELLNQLLKRIELIEEKIINPKKTLNSKEAAKQLGIKLSWLDKLCSRNRITFYKTGKLRYFKQDDLDKYLSKDIVKSEDDLDREADEKFFGKQS